jgi:hypothetical protein
MEHIKTPVEARRYGLEFALLNANGTPVQHWINAAKVEAECVINAHNALLAERDELQAQRDALVGAHVAMLLWEDHMRTCSVCIKGIGPCDVGQQKMATAVGTRSAALALVRGEDDDG